MSINLVLNISSINSYINLDQRVIAEIKWESIDLGTKILGTKQYSWQYTIRGFLRYQFVICETANTTNVLAVFMSDKRGNGYLQLTSGKEYQMVATDFWGLKWSWADEDKRTIMSCSRTAQFWKYQFRVGFVTESMTANECALMAVLGCYWFRRSIEDYGLLAIY